MKLTQNGYFDKPLTMLSAAIFEYLNRKHPVQRLAENWKGSFFIYQHPFSKYTYWKCLKKRCVSLRVNDVRAIIRKGNKFSDSLISMSLASSSVMKYCFCVCYLFGVLHYCKLQVIADGPPEKVFLNVDRFIEIVYFAKVL